MTSRTSTVASQAGFSLVEVLIALFITAMLTGLGTSLVLGTLAGRERFETVAAGARGLELAHAALKTDLGQLAARPVRAPNGESRALVFAGGDPAPDDALMAFARAGADNPDGLEPRGSIVYVEYRLEEDRLVRRSWTRADPTPRTPMIERALISGVESAAVSFARGDVWSEAFASMPGGEPRDLFPDLIALDLEIAGVGQVRQLFAAGYAQ
jgi:general secretion pathway protein J